MRWRVIITDTESATGVAPVCEERRHAAYGALHDIQPDESGAQGTGPLVFECCPHPHLETWSEWRAENLARALTVAEAEPCS